MEEKKHDAIKMQSKIDQRHRHRPRLLSSLAIFSALLAGFAWNRARLVIAVLQKRKLILYIFAVKEMINSIWIFRGIAIFRIRSLFLAHYRSHLLIICFDLRNRFLLFDCIFLQFWQFDDSFFFQLFFRHFFISGMARNRLANVRC